MTSVNVATVNNCQVGFRSFMYMRKGWYWCEMETMKIMNNEKVASLWADKNVTLNTESSFNGLRSYIIRTQLTVTYYMNQDLWLHYWYISQGNYEWLHAEGVLHRTWYFQNLNKLHPNLLIHPHFISPFLLGSTLHMLTINLD